MHASELHAMLGIPSVSFRRSKVLLFGTPLLFVEPAYDFFAGEKPVNGLAEPARLMANRARSGEGKRKLLPQRRTNVVLIRTGPPNGHT